MCKLQFGSHIIAHSQSLDATAEFRCVRCHAIPKLLVCYTFTCNTVGRSLDCLLPKQQKCLDAKSTVTLYLQSAHKFCSRAEVAVNSVPKLSMWNGKVSNVQITTFSTTLVRPSMSMYLMFQTVPWKIRKSDKHTHSVAWDPESLTSPRQQKESQMSIDGVFEIYIFPSVVAHYGS